MRVFEHKVPYLSPTLGEVKIASVICYYILELRQPGLFGLAGVAYSGVFLAWCFGGAPRLPPASDQDLWCRAACDAHVLRKSRLVMLERKLGHCWKNELRGAKKYLRRS